MQPSNRATEGVAVGALAIQGLHAQAKPPVYVIAEIDVSNPDAYAKEFVPLVQSNLGTALAAGKGVTIDGEPAKSRVTVRLLVECLSAAGESRRRVAGASMGAS